MQQQQKQRVAVAQTLPAAVRKRPAASRAATVAEGWQDMAAGGSDEPEPEPEPLLRQPETRRLDKHPARAMERKRDRPAAAAAAAAPAAPAAPAAAPAAALANAAAFQKAKEKAEEEAFFDYVIKEEMQPCWPFILSQDISMAMGATKTPFTVRAPSVRSYSTQADVTLSLSHLSGTPLRCAPVPHVC